VRTGESGFHLLTSITDAAAKGFASLAIIRDQA
jgi:hypothetical protein